MDFRIWALLSALFAGITAILSKKGIETVPPNLALAVRVAVILVIASGIAFATGETKWQALTPRQLGLLAGSAVATGMSWLCYFRALQGGTVAQVAPIDKLSFVVALILGAVVLKERVSPTTATGAALIVVGVLITLKGA